MFVLIATLLATPPLATEEAASLSVSRSHIAASLTGVDQARDTLQRLRTRSWQTCRQQNRHGAMAETGIRLCSRDLLDQLVVQLSLPCLDAVHQNQPLSGQVRSCDNGSQLARNKTDLAHASQRNH